MKLRSVDDHEVGDPIGMGEDVMDVGLLDIVNMAIAALLSKKINRPVMHRISRIEEYGIGSARPDCGLGSMAIVTLRIGSADSRTARTGRMP